MSQLATGWLESPREPGRCWRPAAEIPDFSGSGSEDLSQVVTTLMPRGCALVLDVGLGAVPGHAIIGFIFAVECPESPTVTMAPWSHPILSCADAAAFEQRLFAGDEAREWAAMQRAGRAVAAATADDLEEVGGFPPAGRILTLAGKGHNGGDALIATQALLERFPAATADVVLVFGERPLRPLAVRAWRELAQVGRARIRRLSQRAAGGLAGGYDLCLDGVFGFHFRPPVPAGVAGILEQVNGLSVRLRAAIDLPSGLPGTGASRGPVFRADFTYATGSVKAPLIDGSNGHLVGRLRYLDLGFFPDGGGDARWRVLTSRVLEPLRRLRNAESDKRSHGHVFIIGGSRRFPGAGLMAVLSALRSGAGLVTAFVPESLVPAFAARAPEAIWVGWPETPAGGLALEGLILLRERLDRVQALVIGPGLGCEPETLALVAEIVRTSPVPLLLDADALQPDIVRAGTAPRVLTPHLGELRRILQGEDLYRTSAGREAIIVIKGRQTVVTVGGRRGAYSPFGGPVLARGGSGDVLAGLMGTLLAQTPADPLLAAARGVVWQGMAADALARRFGQVAVQTTQLLDFLPEALRKVDSPGVRPG